MMSTNHNFLFESLSSQIPRTARKVHIRRLYDVLQLCIHRNEMQRASQAWSILARCKEVHWMELWKTGLLLIGANLDGEQQASQRLDYLRTMMLRHQNNREHILQEIVVYLIQSNRHREALDELQLYLPSAPYQDNPVLHIYAGLLCLYLAQSNNSFDPPNATLLRDSQSHLECAQHISPNNAIVQGFLAKISESLGGARASQEDDIESEDDELMKMDNNLRSKRILT